MGQRKTIDVHSMLAYANDQLKRTDEYATIWFKAGICLMIEHILMSTDNYRGFMFIDNNDSDINTLGYYSRAYYFDRRLQY